MVRFLLLFIFSLLVCVAALSAQEFTDETLFDLYAGGTFKGYATVRYGGDVFEIVDQDEVIAQLKTVKDPEKFRELLTGSITKERVLPGVGRIRFDADTFRVAMELEEQMVSGMERPLSVRLGDPVSDLSLRQDVQVTELYGDEDAGSFSYLTYVGKGKYWGEARGIENRGAGQDELETLAGNAVLGNYLYQAGLLRSVGSRTVSSLDFLGASFRTEERTFGNEEDLRSSALQIFVSTRSRVDFYRGGTLIDTQMLDFGLQEVDTNRFPQGSYLIRIVLTSLSGERTEQVRHFTKSGMMALRGVPTLLLQGGVLRERDDPFSIIDAPLAEGLIGYRATDWLSLEGSAGLADDVTTQGLDVRVLYEDYFVSAGVSAIDGGDFAYSASFTGSFWGVDLVASYDESITRTFDDLLDPGDVFLPPSFADLDQADDEEIRQEQSFGYLSKRIGDLELRLEGNWVKPESSDEQYYYGPRAIYRIFENENHRWAVETSVFRTQEGQQGIALLSYTYRDLPWSVENRLDVRFGGSADDNVLSNALLYDTLESRTNRGARGEIRQDATSNEDESIIHSADLRYGGRYGAGEVFAQYPTLEGEEEDFEPTYGLQADASVIVNSKGYFATGPAGSSDSVVVVGLLSHSDSARAEVVVDGRPVGEVEEGSSIAVGVESYREYEIGIRPLEDGALLHYDPEFKKVLLFPGSTVRLEWEVDRVFIGLGTIVDQGGEPLRRKRILGGKESAITEDDGSFQINISGHEVLTIKSGGKECTVQLPEISSEKVEYFYEYGELPCL